MWNKCVKLNNGCDRDKRAVISNQISKKSSNVHLPRSENYSYVCRIVYYSYDVRRWLHCIRPVAHITPRAAVIRKSNAQGMILSREIYCRRDRRDANEFQISTSKDKRSLWLRIHAKWKHVIYRLLCRFVGFYSIFEYTYTWYGLS